MVQQLLQSLPLYSYLSHVLTHAWAGLYQDRKALEHDNMHVGSIVSCLCEISPAWGHIA